MARTGRPAVVIELRDGEKEELERLSRRSRTNRDVSVRAKIVLALASGETGTSVGARLHVSKPTIVKWRKRFAEGRVEALYDEARPGAPRRIADEEIERAVVATLEEKPEGSTHWSSRILAEKLGMSQSSVSRIWRAFGLRPDRSGTFKLSPDPLLVEKVRDIVGVYAAAREGALVLCVDEKSQIQALERSQPVIPMQIGQEELRTHDYLRHGTTTLFAALNVATGGILGKCYGKHRSVEFLKFLDLVDAGVPKDLDVHVVMDNYGTHKTKTVQTWFLERPHYHVHFTPTYSSWLNQVERWFAILTQRAIKRGSHRSTRELEQAIREFIDAYNADPKPFVWVKTADDILSSIARFAQRTAKLAEPTIRKEFTDSGD
jgi:transposase